MTDAPRLSWPRVVVNGARSRVNRLVHTRECQALRQANGDRPAHPTELRDLSVCDYCSGAYQPAEVEQDDSLYRALLEAGKGGGDV
jgi:hypothetical protein